MSGEIAQNFPDRLDGDVTEEMVREEVTVREGEIRLIDDLIEPVGKRAEPGQDLAFDLLFPGWFNILPSDKKSVISSEWKQIVELFSFSVVIDFNFQDNLHGHRSAIASIDPAKKSAAADPSGRSLRAFPQ